MSNFMKMMRALGDIYLLAVAVCQPKRRLVPIAVQRRRDTR